MYMLLASAQACGKLRQCITSPARVGISRDKVRGPLDASCTARWIWAVAGRCAVHVTVGSIGTGTEVAPALELQVHGRLCK